MALSEAMQAQIDKRTTKVFNAIKARKKSGAKISDLVTKTALNKNQIRVALKHLRDDGRVSLLGVGKMASYYVR